MALFRLRKWLDPAVTEAAYPCLVTAADHPELDEPDGEVGFEDYLDVICKLDLTLLDLEKRERLEDRGAGPAG